MTNKTFHLLPARERVYSVKLLQDEYLKNGAVRWSNIQSNGLGAQVFNKEDIVYIYYADLKDGQDRILFRGEVLESNKESSSLNITGNDIVIGNVTFYTECDFTKAKLRGRCPHIQNKTYLCNELDLMMYKRNKNSVIGGFKSYDIVKYKRNLDLVIDLENAKQDDLTKLPNNLL